MTVKRSMALIVAVLAIMVIVGGFSEGAYAKDKTPGKPKLKMKVDLEELRLGEDWREGCDIFYRVKKVTFSWKKVKNAKKYEVWYRKFGEPWHKVATFKSGKKKYKFVHKKMVIYDCEQVYRVCAVNGKKRKYSNGVYYRADSPWEYKSDYEPDTDNDILVEGERYLEDETPFGDFKGSRITAYSSEKWAKQQESMTYYFTKNGIKGVMCVPIGKEASVMSAKMGEFSESWGEWNGQKGYDPDKRKEFDYTIAHGYGLASWAENVVLCWTLDNTDPQLGQEDLYGDTTGLYSKYEAPYIQMRGTVKYGDGFKEILPNCSHAINPERDGAAPDAPLSYWVKAYRDGELVGEWYCHTESLYRYGYPPEL